jgi:hypothetical protein
MSFTIVTGRIRISEPDGAQSDYERFTVTLNPDGTRTMRTLTRSPKGDLLRDVNQLDAADWRPIEGIGRLFYKGEAHGTVVRRVFGDKLQSWVWNQGTPVDYGEFDAPPHLTVGYHPILHEAWKMNFVDPAQPGWQELLTHTVSNTWNGRSLGHGMKLKSSARFEGIEEVTTPAGKFRCQRFTWLTPFDKELHIWRTGPLHILVKEVVARGDKHGSVYELSDYAEERVAWSPGT